MVILAKTELTKVKSEDAVAVIMVVLWSIVQWYNKLPLTYVFAVNGYWTPAIRPLWTVRGTAVPLLPPLPVSTMPLTQLTNCACETVAPEVWKLCSKRTASWQKLKRTLLNTGPER